MSQASSFPNISVSNQQPPSQLASAAGHGSLNLAYNAEDRSHSSTRVSKEAWHVAEEEEKRRPPYLHVSHNNRYIVDKG